MNKQLNIPVVRLYLKRDDKVQTCYQECINIEVLEAASK